MVTEVSSAPLQSTDTPSWALSWDKAEMLSYLEKGICKQVETTERIGIQPFWIKNIEVGAMEELRQELGKWSKTHQGYLLGFKRPVLLPSFGMQGRHPQPFSYYKFNVVRYLYTPTEGQQLKGVITQFGQKAASCVVFAKFIATVYPRNEKEFNGWDVGDEIEFVVESFEKLHRGVTIKGKCVGGKVKKSGKKKLVEVEPMGENELDSSTVESSEPPKKKSGKRKLKIEVEPTEVNELDTSTGEIEPAESSEPTKKKSGKRKLKIEVDPIGVNELNTSTVVTEPAESSEPPKKKRKKSKKVEDI